MYNPEKQARQGNGRFGGRAKPQTVEVGGWYPSVPTMTVPVELEVVARRFLNTYLNAPPGAIVPVPVALTSNPHVIIQYPVPAYEGPAEQLGQQIDKAAANMADELVEAGIVAKPLTQTQATLAAGLFVALVAALLYGAVSVIF